MSGLPSVKCSVSYIVFKTGAMHGYRYAYILPAGALELLAEMGMDSI